MKIAWITYDFEEYSVLHVNAMAQEHEVLLISPQPDADACHYPLHPDVESYAFAKPRLRQPLKQLHSIQKILKRVSQFAPDVVHFQQGHMWFNAVLKRLKKYPLVITIHDPRHHEGDQVSRKTPQWLLDYGFRQADHVIVHGDAIAESVEKTFEFEPKQIHTIPHVAMGMKHLEAEEDEDENLVLFFGRIWDYKGLDQLIAAEPLVHEEVPEARIMIAGEGDDFSKYQAMMKNPEHFIVRNAWISDLQRARFFQRSALVVLPYNEATQSGVIPVASNHGKPVVATRVGALAECVDHGQTGILVPPRDPNALAEAIIRLLKDKQLRHEMGRAAKAKLELENSPRAVSDLTLEVYYQAVADRGLNVISPVQGESASVLETSRS